jgi:hypothetical protein
MLSKALGTLTSEVEITNVDNYGIWILVNDREYFLSYKEYPWFRNANIKDIIEVELLNEFHLYWRTLDVDLCIDSLEKPDEYPLIAK